MQPKCKFQPHMKPNPFSVNLEFHDQFIILNHFYISHSVLNSHHSTSPIIVQKTPSLQCQKKKTTLGVVRLDTCKTNTDVKSKSQKKVK